MTRRAILLVVLTLVVAACTTSEAATRGTGTGGVRGTGGSGPTGTTGPTPSPEPDPPRPPRPEEEIPESGVALARALEEAFGENRAAIAAWIADADPATWPPPREVVLWTLYEQRMCRMLAAHEHLADRVLDRLPHRVAAEATLIVRAGHALYEHFAPVSEVPDFRIRRPEPADALAGYFLEAEERFGIDHEVLAAIMLIETRMGRIRSRSSAGAQGPMQFLPATWDAYGLGGDVHDPHDAVLGAANYLDASGAPEDYRRALYAYNPVNAYVVAVTQYAKVMRRFPDAYYAFYNWQVFVRTVDGDVRLSGPGL